MIFLSGELGVGKSVIARAIIRHLGRDESLEVPSPTYTIYQSYDTPLPIAHFDLYRLSSADELDELGWREFLKNGCILIEWPENGFDPLPNDAILLQIEDQGDLRLADTASDNFVAFQAATDTTENYTVTMPAAQGTANQWLINDGSGNMTWTNTPTIAGTTFTDHVTIDNGKEVRYTEQGGSHRDLSAVGSGSRQC